MEEDESDEELILIADSESKLDVHESDSDEKQKSVDPLREILSEDAF
jgi:hypothetical protein